MMKSIKTVSRVLVMFAIAITLACSNNSQKAPDVSGDIRNALDQAGLNHVSVSQDRDKSVVTLKGDVPSQDDKSRADSIAKSIAGNQVVADEISVQPRGEESRAKKTESKLDSGIDNNLEAMLVEHNMDKDVRYDVSQGVVTLKGNVPSQSERSSAEKLAKQVPNVKQVVNELEVKGQKATSSQ